jgi:hypothetical protein
LRKKPCLALTETERMPSGWVTTSTTRSLTPSTSRYHWSKQSGPVVLGGRGSFGAGVHGLAVQAQERFDDAGLLVPAEDAHVGMPAGVGLPQPLPARKVQKVSVHDRDVDGVGRSVLHRRALESLLGFTRGTRTIPGFIVAVIAELAAEHDAIPAHRNALANGAGFGATHRLVHAARRAPVVGTKVAIVTLLRSLDHAIPGHRGAAGLTFWTNPARFVLAALATAVAGHRQTADRLDPVVTLLASDHHAVATHGPARR